MMWDWLKVSNASKISSLEKTQFKNTINVVYEAILNDEFFLVHCSAGLHRTGMFAYALLRKGGSSYEDSLEIIRKIRLKTYDALDQKYITLAEELY